MFKIVKINPGDIEFNVVLKCYNKNVTRVLYYCLTWYNLKLLSMYTLSPPAATITLTDHLEAVAAFISSVFTSFAVFVFSLVARTLTVLYNCNTS